jgi:hypothetical protein
MLPSLRGTKRKQVRYCIGRSMQCQSSTAASRRVQPTSCPLNRPLRARRWQRYPPWCQPRWRQS